MRWCSSAALLTAGTMALAGCGGGGGGGSAVPTPTPTPTSTPSLVAPLTDPRATGPTTSAAVVPDGFSAVIIEVTQPDGTTDSYCVWLAETGEQREQGLMNVTSLGGADGMLFRFGGDQTTSFWMKDTLLPLSIAFVAGDGGFVSATDMEPCAPDVAACPVYGADGPYADALEVSQGELGSLGIGPGARLTVTGTACAPSG